MRFLNGIKIGGPEAVTLELQAAGFPKANKSQNKFAVSDIQLTGGESSESSHFHKELLEHWKWWLLPGGMENKPKSAGSPQVEMGGEERAAASPWSVIIVNDRRGILVIVTLKQNHI